MGRFFELALSLLAAQAVGSYAQAAEQVEELEEPTKSPNLAVQVTASFPAAEIFGIKLVNGKPTQALLSFTNEETEAVTVNFIGGSLWTPDFDPQGSRIVRNLTTTRYNVEIPAGEKQSLAYNFATELHPQELRLNLATILSDTNGAFYTVPAFNETVSIVEPDTSIFDPQIIFLYLFILACIGGVVYFFYTIWIAPYFPQKRTRGGGERVKRGAAKKGAADEGIPVPGADGPAVTTTGAKAYNEDWIPAQHLQRPEARRVKSGTPRPKSRSKPEA